MDRATPHVGPWTGWSPWATLPSFEVPSCSLCWRPLESHRDAHGGCELEWFRVKDLYRDACALSRTMHLGESPPQPLVYLIWRKEES